MIYVPIGDGTTVLLVWLKVPFGFAECSPESSVCLKSGNHYTDLATADTQQIIATGKHTSVYCCELLV